MTKYAEAFVSIGAQLNNSSFGGIKQKITSQITSIGESASASLAKSLSGIGVGLAGAFGAWKIFETAKFGVSLAAQAEQAQEAFETMLGSAQEAQKLMASLQKFAAQTPFEFPELRDASKKLLAFGVTAGDIIPTMRMLGDISAGIGAPIGELAELYGKAKVQGRLFAEDINQFQGRGINVTEQLAKKFGDVRKAVEQGRVGFADLQQALIAMTAEGSRFGGGMAKQAETLQGKWSTFMDSIKADLTTAGALVVESLNFKGILTDVTALNDEMSPLVHSILMVADGADMLADGLKVSLAAATSLVATLADMRAQMLEASAWTTGDKGIAAQADAARAFAKVAEGAAASKWLEAQIAVTGKMPSEMAAGRLKEMKSLADSADAVNKSLKPEGPSVFDTISKDAKKADDYIADLTDKVRMLRLGLTAEQFDLVKLYENFEIPREKVQEAIELSKEHQRLLKEQEQQKAADDVTKDMATPAEQYAAKLKELEGLRDSGKLAPEMFERAKFAEQEKVKLAVGIERDPGEELGAKILDLMNLRDVGAINEATFQRARTAAEEETKRKEARPGDPERRQGVGPGMVGLADMATNIQMAVLGAKDPMQQQQLATQREIAMATKSAAESLAAIRNGANARPRQAARAG